jgi:hypothetical protein
MSSFKKLYLAWILAFLVAFPINFFLLSGLPGANLAVGFMCGVIAYIFVDAVTNE